MHNPDRGGLCASLFFASLCCAALAQSLADTLRSEVGGVVVGGGWWVVGGIGVPGSQCVDAQAGESRTGIGGWYPQVNNEGKIDP